MIYNYRQSVNVSIIFDSVDDFLKHRKFLKSNQIVPLGFNPDNIEYGKAYTAYYSKEDAEKLVKWIKENKGRINKNLYL